MKFTINREALLRPLQLVAGVVERRQTLPVLSNVLLVVDNSQLFMTGTDLEVELVGCVALDEPSEKGEVTVPARKLMDICKSLPDGALIEFSLSGERVKLKTGRSRFTLSSLPASEFPNTEEEPGSLVFTIGQAGLRRLIDRTGFAMAQQDVRYYLNGMLLEVSQNCLRSVATDGHRMAMCAVSADINQEKKHQVVVPRKGILEMARLLTDGDEDVHVSMSASHIRAKTGGFIFTSKLVDGRFPDYDKALPRGGDKVVIGGRQELRHALQRASIISNERFRGVQLTVSYGNLKVVASNLEQEEAKEDVEVSYEGETVVVGFNASYLLDVLSVLSGDSVRITLSDPNTSALMEEDSEDGDSSYVVMPMRL